MAGPLEGVKVVELGVWVAGPAAGGILADWGAEVVKIEPPAGDPSRTFQYSLTGQMMPTNPIFEMDNRSKRSIVLDLTTPEGKEIADDLIADADVFVTNVRLGGLERLGLDAETLTTRHPRLIYAAITGYGMEGEDADRAAYDIAAFWSRSGIAHLLTRPGEDPPFQRGGMGDHNAGLAGAAAVCAALYSRENRRGQLVSTSLLREGLYTISFDLSVLLGWGLTLQIGQRESMGNVAMNNYSASDGKRFWVVGLDGMRHWPRCTGGGARRLARRRALRRSPQPGPQCGRDHRPTRRDLRNEDHGGVGRGVRDRTRLLLGTGQQPRRPARRPAVLCLGALSKCPTARAPRT